MMCQALWRLPEINIKRSQPSWFTGTVAWLRISSLTPQPLHDESTAASPARQGGSSSATSAPIPAGRLGSDLRGRGSSNLFILCSLGMRVHI